jgi:hypothetical protein
MAPDGAAPLRGARCAAAPLAAGAQQDALRGGGSHDDAAEEVERMCSDDVAYTFADDAALLDLDDLDALLASGGSAAGWPPYALGAGLLTHDEAQGGAGAAAEDAAGPAIDDEEPNAACRSAPAALRCLDGSHAADCTTCVASVRVHRCVLARASVVVHIPAGRSSPSHHAPPPLTPRTAAPPRRCHAAPAEHETRAWSLHGTGGVGLKALRSGLLATAEWNSGSSREQTVRRSVVVGTQRSTRVHASRTAS